jgi:hypothetical protein
MILLSIIFLLFVVGFHHPYSIPTIQYLQKPCTIISQLHTQNHATSSKNTSNLYNHPTEKRKKKKKKKKERKKRKKEKAKVSPGHALEGLI